MEAKYEGTNFFYSGHDPELANTRLDWLGELTVSSSLSTRVVTFSHKRHLTFFFTQTREMNAASDAWKQFRLKTKRNLTSLRATSKRITFHLFGHRDVYVILLAVKVGGICYQSVLKVGYGPPTKHESTIQIKFRPAGATHHGQGRDILKDHSPIMPASCLICISLDDVD